MKTDQKLYVLIGFKTLSEYLVSKDDRGYKVVGYINLRNTEAGANTASIGMYFQISNSVVEATEEDIEKAALNAL